MAPIGPTSEGWAEIAKALPVVAIGDALRGAATAGEVVFDNHRGVEAVMRHLHGLGHRRIAVLTPSIEATDHRPTETPCATGPRPSTSSARLSRCRPRWTPRAPP